VVVHRVPGDGSGPPWGDQLRAAREAVGLSRAALAERSGVSGESLRAYETGRRRPTRAGLTAVLDGLALDPATRNTILRDAGFSPDGTWIGQQADQPDHSLEEAVAVIERTAWPMHVNTETFQVLAANQAAQRVWGVDLAVEYPDPIDRNMLAILSTPRFADRILNWDEAMAMAAAMVKGGYGGTVVETAEANPYLSAVIERFLEGDPGYVQRFLRIWADTEPHVRKWRFSFPITWARDTGEPLRFEVLVSPANFSDYMTFSDWIPLDATTWQALNTTDG
jgi:transcriptional regulator with XRE-family HTH domain